MKIVLSPPENLPEQHLSNWLLCAYASCKLGTPGRLPRAEAWSCTDWERIGLTRWMVGPCMWIRVAPNGSGDWLLAGTIELANERPISTCLTMAGAEAKEAAKKPKRRPVTICDDVLIDDAVVKTVLQRRAERLFNRRETTPWCAAELRAWEKARIAVAATDPDQWELLEWWFSLKSGDVYRRKDLGTLLNNWNAELDRAADYRARNGNRRTGDQSRAV